MELKRKNVQEFIEECHKRDRSNVDVMFEIYGNKISVRLFSYPPKNGLDEIALYLYEELEPTKPTEPFRNHIRVLRNTMRVAEELRAAGYNPSITGNLLPFPSSFDGSINDLQKLITAYEKSKTADEISSIYSGVTATHFIQPDETITAFDKATIEKLK